MPTGSVRPPRAGRRLHTSPYNSATVPVLTDAPAVLTDAPASVYIMFLTYVERSVGSQALLNPM